MNMIKNFSKETKKTIVKEKVKKTASAAKKFGFAAAGVALITVLIVAVKKGKKKIKKGKVTETKGAKPKGYIDAELVEADEEGTPLGIAYQAETNIQRTHDGSLVLQGEK